MFKRTDPKTMMKWLIVAALVYLVLPYDLFPDFLGLVGRIDDVLIMAWLAWFYRNHLKQFAAAGLGQEPIGGGARSHRQAGQDFPAGSKTAEAFDAYAVLGIPRSASSDSIQAAYRARMREYHPDKVAHLGEELQSLAHEKAQQIQRAYQELRR